MSSLLLLLDCSSGEGERRERKRERREVTSPFFLHAPPYTKLCCGYVVKSPSVWGRPSSCRSRPLLSECRTYKTVKARAWPCSSSISPYKPPELFPLCSEAAVGVCVVSLGLLVSGSHQSVVHSPHSGGPGLGGSVWCWITTPDSGVEKHVASSFASGGEVKRGRTGACVLTGTAFE